MKLLKLILTLSIWLRFDCVQDVRVNSGQRCNLCTKHSIHEQGKQFIYDCSNCGLQEIPQFHWDAIKIHISFNKISMIRNLSFLGLSNLTEIYIDHNELSVIEKNSFAVLKNLQILVLADNYLTTSSLEIIDFLKNINLIFLDISRNRYNNYSNSIEQLTNLETLKLDIFPRFRFDKKFESLTKLKVFEFATRTDKIKVMFQNDTFEGLCNSPITDLRIVLRRQLYKRVGVDFLKPFRYLKRLKLDIGGLFDIKDVLMFLHGLRYRSLDYMDLSGNNRDFMRHHHLTVMDIDNLLTICLKGLNLYHNDIYYFPFLESLNTNFSKCLEKLNIGYNKMPWTASEVFGLMYYQSLTYLDVSTPPLYHLSKFYENNLLTKSNFSLKLTSNFLKKLQYFDFSGFPISTGLVYPDNHVFSSVYFYFPKLETAKATNSDNDICSRDITINSSLHYLDMSSWNCKHLNSKFIMQFEDLTFLNASNSKIGHHVNVEFNLLHGLYKLQDIDFSSNGISHFSPDFFIHQTVSLRNLNISNNRLSRVPSTLMNMKNILTVDLRHNNLANFSIDDRNIIDMLENTTFDFEGMILECTCKYVDTFVWLNTTKTKIKKNLLCKDSTNASFIVTNIRTFQLNCLSTFWLDFSVIMILLVMVVILLAAMGYRNKSFVIYLYIKARRFMKQKDIIAQRYDYKYDVFVSYSHLDYDWVTGPLLNYLSNELSLEVCLHQKDFIPGEPIASEILRCVESSRKTVFVITRNFLASKWSMMEMDIARHHVFNDDNDTILVILKEDIPVHEMPSSLRKIWWRIVCLKYPQNDSQFEHELFEKKLSDAFK